VFLDAEFDVETIRIFNAIEKSRIDQDLDDAPENFEEVQERIQAFTKLKDSEITPAQYADHLHDQLVFAYAAVKSPMAENIPIFFARFAASDVAHLTVGIAFRSRNLGKTEQKLLEMRRAVGIDDYEDEVAWEGKQKPPGYDEMLEESNELLNKIEEMTFADVLRRYRMRDLADQVESNPDEFHAAAQAGLKAVYDERKFI
jgi:hypothetical protein